ncbi:uncharacterized protein LOC128996498 isoform X2 [Macrosteles quadrilineatus]|uniref:uncharacterized protein LOC128996498 isoform X2 n=1 Tax=Macrosteles quadrilineatus TaxID=74068 RepID=UPI0023E1C5D5|nr:uncharacterized protein LOC128996498 isoform X2 [Macrosteles quadrilineatus]
MEIIDVTFIIGAAVAQKSGHVRESIEINRTFIHELIEVSRSNTTVDRIKTSLSNKFKTFHTSLQKVLEKLGSTDGNQLVTDAILQEVNADVAMLEHVVQRAKDEGGLVFKKRKMKESERLTKLNAILKPKKLRCRNIRDTVATLDERIAKLEKLEAESLQEYVRVARRVFENIRRREKKPKNDRHQQGKQQTPRSRKAQTHAITMVSLRFRHISFVDFMMAFNFVRRSSLLNMAWARVHTAVHWLYPTENPV